MRTAPVQPDPLTSANRLLAQGKYAAAATAYLDIATDRTGAQADDLKALAALAYQDAGDTENAALVVAELGEETSRPVVALAKARSMLDAGFPAEAWTLVGAIEQAPLSPYQRGVHARVAGEAALALGHYAEAADAWTGLYRYPFPSDRREAVVEATWRAVSRLPPAELEARAADGDATATGWYALALIASRSMFDSATFAQDSDEWKAAHPGHVATDFVEQLQERSEALSVRPRQIALLLPFDDNLGGAARAIRDGFLTAWYGESGGASRPAIRVYSSAGDDVQATYERAVAEGAEFVVGPLRKPLVEKLRALGELSTGILALNVVDAAEGVTAPPGFYQFGLTPEDEASQVARKAAALGSRALLMAPDSAWGRRVMETYADAWESQGGSVLAQVYFGDEAQDYSEAVKRALNIDLSEARKTALRGKLSLPLHFEPRRRSDVDVILLAGFPDNARQVLPQLRYFRAETVPVFATSHAYGGGSNAERDRDLDGLVFADMPWLFGVADARSFAEVSRNWPKDVGNYGRLYGLGLDAYRLIPYLGKMRYQQGLRVPGATGDLWMDPDGVVHRNMTWLRFQDGIPGFYEGTRAIRAN